MKDISFNRRTVLKTTTLTALGLAIPASLVSGESSQTQAKPDLDSIPKHFPNIPPKIVEEVVGSSHFDLDRVKTLVDKRPELSRSVWEWRFGDFESAIGAASHVGRRDIALYLINKGARPTLFTHAMLGHYNSIIYLKLL